MEDALPYLFLFCFLCLETIVYTDAESIVVAFKLVLPEDVVFENKAVGSARSADYEIVSIYGRKYIIFSSGSDIEVLEY